METNTGTRTSARLFGRTPATAWAAASLIAVMTAGCVGGSAAQEAADGDPLAAAADQDDEVTLSFWYMPNGSDPEAMIAAEVAEFEAVNPDVKVEVKLLDWGEALTKLATATASGDGPDLAQVGSTWVAGLADTGAFRTFDTADLQRFGGRDAFVAESWTSTIDADSDTIAIPWVVDARVLYYRTDVLDQLGLDPDEAFADWEALEATLQRIGDETDVNPWGMPGSNDWNVVHNATPWIWASGGDVLTADGTGSVLASDAAVEGLYEFQRLVATYGDHRALASSDHDSQKLFADGSYAVTLSGPWFGENLRTEYGDVLDEALWSVAPVPAGPDGRVTFLGGSHLMAFEGSRHPQETMALLEHLTTIDSQRRVAGLTGLLAARQDAMTLSADAAGAFGEALASGRQYPAVPGWLDVETTLQRAFSRMWDQVEKSGRPLGRDDIRRLLDDASQEIDDALGQLDGARG